jgi:hypothetical protein
MSPIVPVKENRLLLSRFLRPSCLIYDSGDRMGGFRSGDKAFCPRPLNAGIKRRDPIIKCRILGDRFIGKPLGVEMCRFYETDYFWHDL